MKRFILILPVIIGIATLVIVNSCGPQIPNPVINKDTICMNYSKKSINQLPVGLVHDMINGYRDVQLKTINRGMNTVDSEAIWFDLETLKKFIYHIELYAKNSGTSTESKDLGIRIYYANYPDAANWHRNKYADYLKDFMNDPDALLYEKKHTLVMIPTIKRNLDSEVFHVDFNPMDTNTYVTNLQDESNNGRYSNGSETLTFGLSVIPKSSSFVSARGTTAQNHGGLFPPKKKDGFGF